MPDTTIRTAFDKWPAYNQNLRDAVASLTEAQLALRASPDGWPLWAIVGHAACQRVFWLCVFAGEPGAETTPFTNSGYECPGDEDLEAVLSGPDLAEALDSTFRIVDGVLDRWTVASLRDVLRRPEWDDTRVHSRGSVIQRLFSHDVYHSADVNGILGVAGLPGVNLWD